MVFSLLMSTTAILILLGLVAMILGDIFAVRAILKRRDRKDASR